MIDQSVAKGILEIYENRHDVCFQNIEEAIRHQDSKLALRTENLIVDIGLSVFTRFLGNNVNAPLVGGYGFAALSDITIGRMEIGDKPSPSTPNSADVDGVIRLQYLPNMIVTYPDLVSVRFSGLIPSAECNDKILTEECLKLRNGQLFARTTYSKAKTRQFSLQFNHTIIVGRP